MVISWESSERVTGVVGRGLERERERERERVRERGGWELDSGGYKCPRLLWAFR